MDDQNSKLCIITELSGDMSDWLPHVDNTLPGAGSAGGEHPDQGLPPFPSHPIVIPPQPEEPIVIPPIDPDAPRPDQTLPGDLPGGGEIPLPPEVSEILENWELKAAWTPENGWFVALIPTGDQLLPTPSK